MKDFIIAIAIFALILFVTPLLLAYKGNNVTQKPATYASGTEAVTIDGKGNETESASGGFKVRNISTGSEQDIPAYDFICGVVAGEMPVEYSPEALKAQAVAAFTYCAYIREHGTDSTCIVTGENVAYLSKSQAQALWGDNFTKNWGKIEDAVQAVEGKAMFFDGDVIQAVYSAMSSGVTESSKDVWGNAFPYLVEVASPGDKLQKDYSTQVTVSEDAFRKKVTASVSGAALGKSPGKWLAVKERSKAGGVIAATLGGKTVSGGDIRTMFGLRSTDFTVSYAKGKFTFHVKGYGHGVGMSQCGAEAMAQQGKSWQDILKWYYKGVTIGNYDWSDTDTTPDKSVNASTV